MRPSEIPPEVVPFRFPDDVPTASGRAANCVSREQQGSSAMSLRTLRFATFLAPNMLPVYAFIARHVQVRLGIPTELIVGTSYQRLSEQAEVSFVCGLAYIELRRLGEPIEPLAAPLLHGRRYD